MTETWTHDHLLAAPLAELMAESRAVRDDAGRRG
jgi:hypothetical protein